MNRSIAVKMATAVCVAALSAVLAGCAPGASTSATEAQQANRAYMSQVNETMAELDANLDQFVAAVSRGDVVNMRTQADNAYKTLDKLANIEAPEDLKDVKDDYVNGTTKLREALDEYISLYTDAAKSDASGDVDKAAFNKRIAEIQSLYDEGVALLQKGDETIAGSSASESSGSASSSSESSSSESSSSESASASSSAAA